MRDPVWLETNQPNLVQHQKARLFSPDAFKTSKYQNLPMYHFQKWLGFSILCDFDTCHKEITIDSLIGSPCIIKDIKDITMGSKLPPIDTSSHHRS